MPKSNQKPADAEQTVNQRGKSRFGSSPRPARVVLPERPPRAVDNEIVSILLGADPASLTPEAGDAGKAPPPEPVEAAPSLFSAPETAAVAVPVDSTYLPAEGNTPQQPVEPPEPDYRATVPPAGIAVDEPKDEPLEELKVKESRARRAEAPAPVKPTEPTSPGHHAPRVPAPRAERKARLAADTQDRSISSFAEFDERWRHGLRKGQLKLCEVLYQKTYAVGQTECVTSFSELSRLSGLKMRQCFNIIAQLEALKFVERTKATGTSNKKDQGSIIRFFLFPSQ